MFKEEFAARIKMARESAGVTTKEAANAVFLAVESYRNYEMGRCQPTPETLKTLCDLFGVSADWLLGRDER